MVHILALHKFMVSPSSGDDYYASLGKTAPQTGSDPLKKKIKIVAKKAVSSASTPSSTPVVEEVPASRE